MCTLTFPLCHLIDALPVVMSMIIHFLPRPLPLPPDPPLPLPLPPEGPPPLPPLPPDTAPPLLPLPPRPPPRPLPPCVFMTPPFWLPLLLRLMAAKRCPLLLLCFMPVSRLPLLCAFLALPSSSSLSCTIPNNREAQQL